MPFNQLRGANHHRRQYTLSASSIMAAAKLSSKPSATGLSFSFDQDDAVTLLVGANEHAILTHGNYLARKSDFFKAALKKEWKEGQPRTIKLPDECPQLMSHYLNYTYSQVLPTSIFVRDFTGTFGEESADFYELLAELYVLGERMLDDAVRTAVTKKIVRLTTLVCRDSRYHYPSKEAANIIYRGTTEGSPARRLMVDVHVRFGTHKWLTADYEGALLCDVAQQLYQKMEANVNCAFCQFHNIALKADEYLD